VSNKEIWKEGKGQVQAWKAEALWATRKFEKWEKWNWLVVAWKCSETEFLEPLEITTWLARCLITARGLAWYFHEFYVQSVLAGVRQW
jgi:hypothetical protein